MNGTLYNDGVQIIGSYNLFRSISFRGITAICKNLRTFSLVDDKRFIASCLDAVVDLDIPIFQWRSCSFNLSLYAMLNG